MQHAQRVSYWGMLFLFVLSCQTATAQTSTFSKVYQIFQANCTVGCHSGGSPSANLDLASSESDVYNALVNQDPVNPSAKADGLKLVDPGYPEYSFLLTKCAYPSWDEYYERPTQYGNIMPTGGAPVLAKEELELMRQWINNGAPETGTVFNEQVSVDFHTTGMGKPAIDIPPAPNPSEGFQVRMGTFHLAPNQEIEFHKKHKINLPTDLEVNRLEIFFNDESHHFILYKFQNDAQAASYPEGFRPPENFNMVENEFVSIWQDAHDISLPEGTAYKWTNETILDFDYHIRNYNPDSILACDVYINVYTQPAGTAQLEMFSNIIPVNLVEFIFGTGDIGQDLIIPPTGQEITISESINIPVPYDDWYVWLLSSHTHQLGTDYDIYRRNPDGSKGEQIFEGFYDFTYSFNQGFYDWEHPPVRYFDPFTPLNLNSGIIHEAKFVNNGTDTVRWGSTTEDEMMLFFIQYTREPYGTNTAIDDELAKETDFMVFPNPFEGTATIRYQLEEGANVELAVYDMMGKQVDHYVNGFQAAGKYEFFFSPSASDFAKGMYFVKLTVDGRSFTHKVIAQ